MCKERNCISRLQLFINFPATKTCQPVCEPEVQMSNCIENSFLWGNYYPLTIFSLTSTSPSSALCTVTLQLTLSNYCLCPAIRISKIVPKSRSGFVFKRELFYFHFHRIIEGLFLLLWLFFKKLYRLVIYILWS